jgi:hypothetical protein
MGSEEMKVDDEYRAAPGQRLGPRQNPALADFADQIEFRGIGKAGDRIRFRGEHYVFEVKASAADGRYLICYCPPHGCVPQMWCLVDFDRGVRGPDDHYGYMGYETAEGVAAMVAALEEEPARVEISYRNNVVLDIASISG